MRIVYPVLWSRPARKACHAQTLATVAALARLGHDVTLLVPRRPHDPPVDAALLRAFHGVQGDFAVRQRASRWVGDKAVPSSLLLRTLLRDPVVAASDMLLSRAPNLMAHGFGCPIPMVVDHYRPWPDTLPILRPLILRRSRQRLCLGFVLHSDFAADSYRRLGCPSEKLMVAHNGVDPALFETPLSATQARRLTGLPEGRAIATYAGRVNAQKGLDQLLEMARTAPDILFVLVGSEGDGPIEREAASLANVRIFPWQRPEKLAAFLFAADVLVIPPSSAPLLDHGNCVLPLKVFSYLAAARPIVAPRSPDTAGLLVHEETALLGAPDDVDAAVAAIRRLLADSALADRLARGAGDKAASLSWDGRARRLTGFFEDRLASLARGDRLELGRERPVDPGLAPGRCD